MHALNHMVTIMCANRAKSESTITRLHMWQAIYSDQTEMLSQTVLIILNCVPYFVIILTHSYRSPPQPPAVPTLKSPVQRCTRNFITFSDEKYYQEAFPKRTFKARSRQARHVCPVTRLQAKYLDPITSIPYANKHAFKVIRDTYMPELEQQMEKSKRSSRKKEKENSTS